jgi:hypothetical protein
MEDVMRLIALLALVPLAACSGAARSEDAPDNSPKSSRTFAVDQFNAVNSAGPDDVDVRVGPSFSVRAEGSQKVLDALEITREGDSLKISRKNDSGFHWGGSDRGAKIYVTMPRMTAASMTGSGDMTVDKVSGDAFAANSTGSGDLSIGMLNVASATLSVTGSGDLKVAGTAKTGNFSIAGSGDIEAPQFKSSSASVSVLGSGSVSAAVAGTANVNSMGSGDVTLTGGAKCTTSKAGSGDVNCS